jgi:c-di-GMP-binding flagellar brake protein YcgR
MFMIQEEKERRYPRVREDIPVRWRLEGPSTSFQEGVVRDLSVGGVKLQVTNGGHVKKGAVLLLEPLLAEDVPYIPQKARFVWKYSANENAGIYFCGIEFIKLSEDQAAMIAQRVTAWFERASIASDATILNNYCHGRERLFF